MSGAPSLTVFILKSCVATINPPWTSQNKGEAADLDFSPLFQLWTFPLLPCFSLLRHAAAGPELPGLSHPTLLTLHRFYSGRSHQRDSPLFLDADAAVEALQNPPECAEDQNIHATEVKTTHFLNFLLYTMDAGRQESSAAHNRAGQKHTF